MLVDADALARDVVEPGTPGLARVVEAFGPDMLDAAGRLDRASARRRRVPGPVTQLAVLNGIVHPLVREAAAGIVATAAATAPSWSRTFRCWWRPARAAVSTWFWWWTPRTTSGSGRMAGTPRHDAPRRPRPAWPPRPAGRTGRPLPTWCWTTPERRGPAAGQVDQLWADTARCPSRTTSAAGSAARRTDGPVAAGRTRMTGRTRRHGSAPGSWPPPRTTSWRWTTSAPRPCPGWRPRTSSTSRSPCPTWPPRTGSRRCLAAAGFPAVPGVQADTPKPDAARSGAVAEALPCQRRPRPRREPARPGRRFAGLAVCAAVPRLARAATRDAAALYEDHKRAWPSSLPATSGTPGYAEAKEPWFTDVAWPRMDEWAAPHGLGAAVVRP